MMVHLRDLLGSAAERESVVDPEKREALGLEASLAFLDLLDTRARPDLTVEEDHLATLEDHWQAIEATMVSKDNLAHKDQKKS